MWDFVSETAGHGILKSGRLHLACIEREQNILSELNSSSGNLIASIEDFIIRFRLDWTSSSDNPCESCYIIL
jgi:hypothetical protein